MSVFHVITLGLVVALVFGTSKLRDVGQHLRQALDELRVQYDDDQILTVYIVAAISFAAIAIALVNAANQ